LEEKPQVNIRKITSLTASLSFLLMLLTSVVLYIVPQGRVAYWADWRLWGLTKTDWGNIHINLGVLFLIALSLHIYYNWKALMSYLKNRARQMRVFTPEFNVALAISAVFIVGTYLLVPPFGWVMTLNDHLKEAGAKKHGEPPYGHAELSSLKNFAKKMNLDLSKSMVLLAEAGYPVEDDGATLQAIARRYRIAPRQVYEVIRASAIDVASTEKLHRLPDSPPPGTGNLTLADFSEQYGADPGRLVQELKKRGIQAGKDSTLKQIASDNGTSPIDLYETIKVIAK
jgi:transcriptional regulator with XRE-family HTH domain